MEKKSKFISPAIFGLTILCFFLPFVAISCAGQELASMSGFKLATGTSINNPIDGSIAQVVHGNGLLMVGLLCAVAGLIFGIIKMGGLNYVLSAGAGAVGFIALLIFRFTISGQVNSSMAEVNEMADIGNMLKIQYKAGFWLSIILFLAAVGYNGYLINKKPTLQEEASYNEIDDINPAIFCSSCGAKQEHASAFCSECGAKLN